MLARVAQGNLAELPSWSLELLLEARVGHLGLLDDDGRPRVLPVTFALAGERLYSIVDEKPKRVSGKRLARVRYLRRRPFVALTVDRYDEDWSKLAWVQVLGTVAVIDRPETQPEAIAALSAKYEAYRHRVPGGPLLELTPERVLQWRAGSGAAGQSSRS
jgi:PPOX class probable F420-dependent enzyme